MFASIYILILTIFISVLVIHVFLAIYLSIPYFYLGINFYWWNNKVRTWCISLLYLKLSDIIVELNKIIFYWLNLLALLLAQFSCPFIGSHKKLKYLIDSLLSFKSYGFDDWVANNCCEITWLCIIVEWNKLQV